MNESFKSNEYANARNKRNNSIHTMKICTFILVKLIASRLSTKITDRTNETTSLPKSPLSSGFQ